jgi:DNA mismatch endonuclease (patch repair protein)
MMAGIRGSNTRPEMLLRKGLHALGWRYRLHGRLPGKPDLVFSGRKALIFANGCFWHGHDCHLFKWPKTREQFWRSKIASNIARDHRVREQLLADSWRVAEVWECTLKGRERLPFEDVLACCDAFLKGSDIHCSVGGDRRVEIDLTQ